MTTEAQPATASSQQASSLVVFGASGDLMLRKMAPALFNLHRAGLLSNALRIVCVARSEFTREQYIEHLRNGASYQPQAEWETFAQRIQYFRGAVDDSNSIQQLDKFIAGLSKEGSDSRLYYMALAPRVMSAGINALGQLGMFAEKPGAHRSVIVEKPFGTDLETANQLSDLTKSYLQESQIFRIDHYLGKDTVRNLLVFRFANLIFEPLWNRNYIDHVQISVLEQIDIGNRFSYYDSNGILKDMFQSHILQLLSLVAMEPPASSGRDALRNEKAKVLEAIRRYTTEEAAANSVRGQYSGYREAHESLQSSSTATFGALRLFVDNWRWQGVPFYLRSGKALKEKITNIVIRFRQPPHAVFAGAGSASELTPNALVISIQPDEGVALRVQNKALGTRGGIQPQMLKFRFPDSGTVNAYERLLLDALQRDQQLFIRTDEINSSWRAIDPFAAAWSESLASQLYPYEPGSWGPSAADKFLEQGRHWLTSDSADIE